MVCSRLTFTFTEIVKYENIESIKIKIALTAAIYTVYIYIYIYMCVCVCVCVCACCVCVCVCIVFFCCVSSVNQTFYIRGTSGYLFSSLIMYMSCLLSSPEVSLCANSMLFVFINCNNSV